MCVTPSQQRRVFERGRRLNEERGGCRGKKVRKQLIEKVGRELGELALQLELHAGGEKGAALEQGHEPGVHAVVTGETPQAIGDTGKVGGVVAHLLVEELQFLLVEIPELAVHAEPGSRGKMILPAPISTSATNSMGMSSGLRQHLGAHAEAHPLVDLVVIAALDDEALGAEPRLVVEDRGLQLLGDVLDVVRLDRDVGEVVETVVEDRLLDVVRAR